MESEKDTLSNFFSAAAENDEGQIIFISGRANVDKFRTSGKYNERVEIYWHYAATTNGMPNNDEAALMEQVDTALRHQVEQNKLAICTGIYTGAGERTWVFYTRTSRVFGEQLNQALQSFEQLPIEIYVENDKEWNEYAEMLEIKDFAD